MGGLLASSVDLQIVEHHVTLALNAKKDERVRDEHPHGVKHVGIVLAVGDDH